MMPRKNTSKNMHISMYQPITKQNTLLPIKYCSDLIARGRGMQGSYGASRRNAPLTLNCPTLELKLTCQDKDSSLPIPNITFSLLHPEPHSNGPFRTNNFLLFTTVDMLSPLPACIFCSPFYINMPHFHHFHFLS